MEKTTSDSFEPSIFAQLHDMAPGIYKGNEANGFWKEGAARNQGEAVALILTEFSEAIEANRLERKLIPQIGSEEYSFFNGESKVVFDSEHPDFYRKKFKELVKDSIEDETADAVIRILDCCYGFGWSLYERDFRKNSTGNFAHDVLKLQKWTIDAFDKVEGKDWGYLLSAIIVFCQWYQIDIVTHVKWKLTYNSMRGAMHGGKKY